MSGLNRKLLATIVASVMLAGSVWAQDVRMFESKDALDARIAEHMAAGTFSDLIDTVAPPQHMSTGRIRLVEQARAGEIPSLQDNALMFSGGSEAGFNREVTAWWNGDAYVYLGLVTHDRTDGVVVLDFLLTNDLRRASRWYLTAEN